MVALIGTASISARERKSPLPTVVFRRAGAAIGSALEVRFGEGTALFDATRTPRAPDGPIRNLLPSKVLMSADAHAARCFVRGTLGRGTFTRRPSRSVSERPGGSRTRAFARWRPLRWRRGWPESDVRFRGRGRRSGAD